MNLPNYIFEQNSQLKNKIFSFISNNPIYQPDSNLSLDQQRTQTYNQMIEFIKSGLYDLKSIKSKPLDYIHTFESLCLVDPTLAIKWGVNLGLFGTSIINLGTEKHTYIIDKLNTGEISGCFAMTELSHGSNVRDLKTTAIYKPDTKTFVINTPSDLDQKYWIGNAAQYADYAVVFAQLLIPNTQGKLDSKGIHPFLVQIRTNGQVINSVHIEDCGHKIGLNGVDNGKIWFNNVEVPLSNMLDKFGRIINNEYQTEIKSNDERFGVMLGALTGGRVSLGSGCIYNAQHCLKLALNYSLFRRQFMDPTTNSNQENLLFKYPIHKFRLLIPLFESLAFNILNNNMKDTFAMDIKNGKISKKTHMLSSLSKVYGSWFTLKTIGECRQACGGHGYSSKSPFGKLANDIDIFTTFEGDNNVLIQQIVKHILGELSQSYKNKSSLNNYLKYITNLINNYIINIDSTESVLNYIKIQIDLMAIQIANKLRTCPKQDRFIKWNQIMIKGKQMVDLYTDYHLLMYYSNWLNKQNMDRYLFGLLKIGENLLRFEIIRRNEGVFYNSIINKLKWNNINDLVNNKILDCLETFNGDDVTKILDIIHIPKSLIHSPLISHEQFINSNKKIVARL